MTDMNTLSPVEAMLAFAANGISTFPCIGKKPRTEHGYKDASCDPEDIHAWSILPIKSFGIPTGEENGFIVLDVDAKSGGLESLKALADEFGSLPKTPTVKTGGGGLHFYLSQPEFLLKNSVGLIAKGIDVRAEGGYVIAPPSIHDSGNKYSFTAPFNPEDFSNLAAPPDWLLDKLHCDAVSEKHVAKPASFWRELVQSEIGEGQRNNVMAQLIGHLLAHRIDPYVALELVECWNKTKCCPPLSANEVGTVLENIGKKELKKRNVK